MFGKVKHHEPDNPNEYWVSFTDLMSALVIILIFVIVFLMMQRGSAAIQQKRIVAKLLADVNYYQTKNSAVTSDVDVVTCEAESMDSSNVFARNLAVHVDRYSELVDKAGS